MRLEDYQREAADRAGRARVSKALAALREAEPGAEGRAWARAIALAILEGKPLVAQATSSKHGPRVHT